MADSRLNNGSQLAGFTKKGDLSCFLEAIAKIEYMHYPQLAPTKEILDAYKSKKIGWPDFETHFLTLLAERRGEDFVLPADLEHACLLCSEPKADKCHRRLVAEYLKGKWGNVQITHL